VPPGFPHYDPNVVKYYKLLKALYGTKQAAAMFHKHLTKVLKSIGYSPTPEDPCLWFRYTSYGLSLLATHVDDLPGCSQDPHERQYLLKALSSWYELSNKLVIHKLLGMNIHVNQEDGKCIVYNDIYIYELLDKLELLHLKGKATPGTVRCILVPNTVGKADPEMHARYRTIVGSGIFIQSNWRMDITYAVGRLSEHMHNPSFEHYDAAIDLLRYLKHTADMGIVFCPPLLPIETPLALDVISFFDADWAKEYDSKSVSGWIISFVTPTEVDHFRSTGVIPRYNASKWASKKQAQHVADSTESAETVAGVSCTKDIIWHRDLLKTLRLMSDQYRPSLICGDNKSTMLSIKDDKLTQTNRWSARKTALMRQEFANGNIEPWWVPSATNLADGFTKHLPPNTHKLLFDFKMGKADVPHALHQKHNA